MAKLFGNAPETQKRVGEKEIAEAQATLTEYKRGKANLEQRIVEDELWWEMRHWDVIKGGQRGRKSEGGRPDIQPMPSSAWLFNTLMNKHADFMDNYPAPIVLPRERSDEGSANTLSEVLPVIMEANSFEQTYSDAGWELLKHGTAAYSVCWDKEKENGLGDISVKQLDLLKVFWEPGIQDIQKSRNLFIVDLMDEDLLNDEYPEFDGKLRGQDIDVKQYVYDDAVDTEKKAVVVDWYYKRKMPDGRTVLHLAKFVGKYLLYASENDPATMDTGIYDHGMYPVVFNTLYPEKGTPVGYGYVAICKDPQMYIDKLYANILESSLMGSKKRFFVSSSTNINEEEFMDWNRPMVHVEGELSDARLQEIVCQPISSTYIEIANQKIEELKETSGNRDVNSGGGSNVTAAAAIAALQEAGNKSSRDFIKASYRAYQQIMAIVIELMRQFYNEARTFRITAPDGMGGYDFVDFSAQQIGLQPNGVDSAGQMLFRKPVFDLKIKAEKTNPFSRMEQNERAKELYGLGFFNPDNAQSALNCLEMMNFEGIEKVKQMVAQGQTMMNMVQQLQMQNAQLQAALTGQMPPAAQPQPQGGGVPQAQQQAVKPSGMTGAVMESQAPRSPYADRLAKRSTPSV